LAMYEHGFVDSQKQEFRKWKEKKERFAVVRKVK